MSENIEMCKVVQLYGFQHLKFRVHPAPEVHDFAVGALISIAILNILIFYIKHGADILAG